MFWFHCFFFCASMRSPTVGQLAKILLQKHGPRIQLLIKGIVSMSGMCCWFNNCSLFMFLQLIVNNHRCVGGIPASQSTSFPTTCVHRRHLKGPVIICKGLEAFLGSKQHLKKLCLILCLLQDNSIEECEWATSMALGPCHGPVESQEWGDRSSHPLSYVQVCGTGCEDQQQGTNDTFPCSGFWLHHWMFYMCMNGHLVRPMCGNHH